ncbi:hypothetical protein HMPREF3038_02791 [Akkermansia sp. KLE1797]|nr:hypothetical protein HMPREF3038_02791 [Akkermansia sp. KLE1797]KXU53109.1 hypothetical protein HMPREF3039_02665 [Akkermansia sp. KLE1798]KZA03747.1 hypothetical protein HMPREF1326_02520 [Akkermansia sp. KLE1605]
MALLFAVLTDKWKSLQVRTSLSSHHQRKRNISRIKDELI